MAENSVFDAVIRAVDQASGPLRAIAANIRGLGGVVDALSAHAKGMGHVLNTAFGEVEHGAHRAEGAMHGAGEAAKKAGHEIAHASHARGYAALAGHIGLLRGHFGHLSVSAGEFGHSISEFLPMLAGLGAAGGLVGLFEIAEHAADKFSLLQKAAITAGVSAQQFANLSFAAKMTDVSVETMGTGLNKLNRAIVESATGKNKEAAAAFAHIHLNVRNASGGFRNAAELLPELAEAFKKTTDPAMRTTAAMTLFGRAGAELLPLLLAGREELEKFAKQSEEVGFVPKGEDAKGLLEYDDALKVLTVASQGFMMAIGTKLAPVLKPIVEEVTEWVTANRDWVATGIADAVKQLGDWIKSLDIKATIISTKEWGETVFTLGGHVSGVTTAVIAMTLALGSPLLSGVTAAIGIFGGLIKVIRGLTLALWANPLILAVAALVVGAALLYIYWDDVVKFITSTWRAIGDVFDTAWTSVTRVVTRVLTAAGDILSSAWTSVSDFFSGIWKSISTAFSEAWTWIVAHSISWMTVAADWVTDAWKSVKQFFVDLWDGIKQAFSDAWDYIKPIVKQVEDAAAAIGHLNPFGSGATPSGPRAPPPAPEMLPFILGFGENLPSPYGAGDAGGQSRSLPALYGPGGAGAVVASAADNRMRAEIVFRNTPPGTRVRTTASGNVELAEAEVGYASPLGDAY